MAKPPQIGSVFLRCSAQFSGALDAARKSQVHLAGIQCIWQAFRAWSRNLQKSAAIPGISVAMFPYPGCTAHFSDDFPFVIHYTVFMKLDFKNLFVILFLVSTAFKYILDFFLHFSDHRNRMLNGTKIPSVLEGQVEKETLLRTVEYSEAKFRLWIPMTLADLVLTVGLVFSGFYVYIFDVVQIWTANPYLLILLFSLFAAIPGFILDLPFSLVAEFVVERRFGFSTISFGQWCLDFLKELVMSLILFVPLLSVAQLLLVKLNAVWFLVFGGVYVVMNLLISFIYPTFIAPLFNRFSPLETGNLKTRLESLLEKNGFRASGIYVMDASKRSRHSNAYFTGIGKSKRIVLYDTLMQQLDDGEIEAVLAHELGHYKKHHIAIKLAFSFVVVFACLFGLSLILRFPSLYQGFGFDPELNGASVANQIQFVGILILGIALSGFLPLVNLVSHWVSRRQEFQADAYSKKICGTGKCLVSALIKLNKENLSQVSIPKVYSIFKYDHPPLLERIEALKD